jgi:hypothetical protein
MLHVSKQQFSLVKQRFVALLHVSEEGIERRINGFYTRLRNPTAQRSSRR